MMMMMMGEAHRLIVVEATTPTQAFRLARNNALVVITCSHQLSICLTGHHRDSIWIGMGIHLPASDDEDTVRKRRHHRKKQQPASTTIVPSMPVDATVAPADDLSLLGMMIVNV